MANTSDYREPQVVNNYNGISHTSDSFSYYAGWWTGWLRLCKGIDQLVDSNALGWIINNDGFLTHISYNNLSTGVNPQILVYRNGILVATASYTGVKSFLYDIPTPIPVSKGDEFSVFHDKTGGVGLNFFAPTCYLFFAQS